MFKIKTKNLSILAFIAVLVIGIVLISGCVKKEITPTKPETIIPDDSPQLPSRFFFMSILPTTAQGQSFDDSYSKAAQYLEFIPVWGRPTPFYNLAAD